eukprot:764889-Hanusia_phi.AAC.4
MKADDGCEKGHGMFEDSHGSRYTGDWKDGKMHGEGVCETVEGESTTERKGMTSVSNAFPTKGTAGATSKVFPMDGERNVYEGEYAMGKIHGKGTIRFPDNRRFEGDFVDNKKHGRGRYEGNTGVYEGEYSNGLLYLGEYTVMLTIRCDQGRRMVSEFSHGLMAANMRESRSQRFSCVDSDLVGSWKNDLMHDKAGKKTEKDGRMFSVEYVQGKLIHANPLMGPMG